MDVRPESLSAAALPLFSLAPGARAAAAGTDDLASTFQLPAEAKAATAADARTVPLAATTPAARAASFVSTFAHGAAEGSAAPPKVAEKAPAGGPVGRPEPGPGEPRTGTEAAFPARSSVSLAEIPPVRQDAPPAAQVGDVYVAATTLSAVAPPTAPMSNAPPDPLSEDSQAPEPRIAEAEVASDSAAPTVPDHSTLLAAFAVPASPSAPVPVSMPERGGPAAPALAPAPAGQVASPSASGPGSAPVLSRGLTAGDAPQAPAMPVAAPAPAAPGATAAAALGEGVDARAGRQEPGAPSPERAKAPTVDGPQTSQVSSGPAAPVAAPFGPLALPLLARPGATSPSGAAAITAAPAVSPAKARSEVTGRMDDRAQGASPRTPTIPDTEDASPPALPGPTAVPLAARAAQSADRSASASIEAVDTTPAVDVGTAPLVLSMPGQGLPPPQLGPAVLGTSLPAPPADAPAGTHPVVSGVPVGVVPVEIGLKSLAGINRFDIRLDPEDLGQIDVRLEISERGTVKAQIVVETPEALASLHRDGAMLERAFEQAGLRTGDEGISLSLRQHGQGEAGQHRGEGRESQGSSRAAQSDASENRSAPEPSPRRTVWSRASGVDRHI